MNLAGDMSRLTGRRECWGVCIKFNGKIITLTSHLNRYYCSKSSVLDVLYRLRAISIVRIGKTKLNSNFACHVVRGNICVHATECLVSVTKMTSVRVWAKRVFFMSSKSWKDVMKNQDRQAESMQNLSSDSDSCRE